MKKVLILLISLTIIGVTDTITFKELATLTSEDLGTNIFVDKDVKDYTVEFNIAEHQNRGDIFEFFKIVLFDHNLFLQYNKRGKFYYIREETKKVEPAVLSPEPIPFPDDELHYYSYKIKNITNKDVVKVTSIFPKIKIAYLSQSDIIAYSATKKMHKKIQKLLKSADNTVKSQTVKITLFTTNRTKLSQEGANLQDFSYNLDASIARLFTSLKEGSTSLFQIKDKASLNLFLSVLNKNGYAEINQEPTVLLTNGITASVSYVKNIAYKVSATTRNKNEDTTVDQLNYRDVGFKINLLPKIKANWVFLDLELTSEDLLTDDKNNIPVTQKIYYKNSVKVFKGRPLLLTGLKKTSKIFEKTGIPVLRDIPIVNLLFGSNSEQNYTQDINLLIEVI